MVYVSWEKRNAKSLNFLSVVLAIDNAHTAAIMTITFLQVILLQYVFVRKGLQENLILPSAF